MHTNYIFSLQALRALAFAGILTYHCGLLPLGAWGVSIFFILSGFVIMLRYHEKEIACSLRSNLCFAFKCIRKIYPLHIFMTVVVIIRDYIQFGVIDMNMPKLIANLLLLSSWFPKSMGLNCYNGVAWFLSSILFSYFMFPVFVKIFKRDKPINPVAIVLFILGLQGLLLLLYNFLNVEKDFLIWLSYENPVFRAGDFLIGMALFSIYSCQRERSTYINKNLGIACLLLLGVTCLLDLTYFRPHQIDAFRKTLLYSPTAIMFVYLFAFSELWLSRLLTTKTMVYLGNMSGLYFLIHQFMIYNAKWAIYGAGEWGGLKDKMVVCIVAALLTVCFAYIFKKLMALFAN